jgi:NAD(P)-dependent dehydrogenase (short-subunit alcohol dehydrogenase family)
MMSRKETTKDGFELQFGVNHLSHFLLINLLMLALLSASTLSFQSRVVVLSSTGHKFSSVNFKDINLDGKFEAMQAYGQSKTANLWTANEIESAMGLRDSTHSAFTRGQLQRTWGSTCPRRRSKP